MWAYLCVYLVKSASLFSSSIVGLTVSLPLSVVTFSLITSLLSSSSSLSEPLELLSDATRGAFLAPHTVHTHAAEPFTETQIALCYFSNIYTIEDWKYKILSTLTRTVKVQKQLHSPSLSWFCVPWPSESAGELHLGPESELQNKHRMCYILVFKETNTQLEISSKYIFTSKRAESL